jgi:uncharacterized surface protein with fasciclin (FAS1) repeats
VIDDKKGVNGKQRIKGETGDEKSECDYHQGRGGASKLGVVCITTVSAQGMNKDIVDTAVAAGQFNTPAKALQAAGLVDTLKGPGLFAVFAPTDEAFAKLPAGTLDDLLKDIPKLKGILTYHVVAGKVMAADVVKMKSAKTVNGQSVQITVKGGKVMVDKANVVNSDIECSNGLIPLVLLP